MRQSAIAVLTGTLLAVLLAPAASPGWQEPAHDAVQGRGAAGVTEVGRPLDVLRSRAERQARQRAVEDLVGKVIQQAGEELDDKKRQKLARLVEERAAGKQALWQTRFWTNGAVSTSVMINTADLLGPGEHSSAGEK